MAYYDTQLLDAIQGIERQLKRVADALEELNKPKIAEKASPESERPKTYRDAIARVAPRHIGSGWAGGVRGCPGAHFAGAMLNTMCDHELECKDCWDREYKGELFVDRFWTKTPSDKTY